MIILMLNQTPQTVVNKTWRKIPANIKVTFFSSFVIGLFTHMYMFTNTLPNHDEVISLVGYLTWATEINGRWFLGYASAISSMFSMPWVNGMLSMLYLSVSACFIISTTQVKKYISCVLISGILITIPIVAGILSYMQHADPFFLGIMLSSFAAFLAVRYKYGFFFAPIPIVLSLAIYQAFYGVTAALLIIVLILEVLDNQTSWKKTFIKGLKFAGALGAGILLYFVSIRIFYPDGLTDPYQGLNQMGYIPTSDLTYVFRRAYIEIIRFFIRNSRNFHYAFMQYVFLLSFAACGVLIMFKCLKPGRPDSDLQKSIIKQPMKLLLLGVLFILFPLGCNIIYIMGSASTLHDLMIYATVFIPVFLLVIADKYLQNNDLNGNIGGNKKFVSLTSNIAVWIITLSSIFLMFNYWNVSNRVYFKLNIAYETTFAQSILLVSHIQSVPGYTYDSDIVLVGLPHIPQGIPELENITITGAIGSELFGNWTYTYFLRNYLNFTQNVVHLRRSDLVYRYSEVAHIIDIVRDMPSYPNSGSIVMIDGVIYVRFPFIDECCLITWPNVDVNCCLN